VNELKSELNGSEEAEAGSEKKAEFGNVNIKEFNKNDGA